MTLTRLGPGVAYEPITRTFGVRPACPRCPWRSSRGVVAGSYKWRQWVALDVARHDCSNPPDRQEETP